MIVRILYGAVSPFGPSIFRVPMQWARMMLCRETSTVGSLMKPGFPVKAWRRMKVIAERRSDSQIPARPISFMRVWLMQGKAGGWRYIEP